MRTILLLLLLGLALYSNESLFQPDWSTVASRARDLKQAEGQSVPQLLQLMDDERFVRLTGTADLIYPGAQTFYGHGYVINYSLNWLPARAGWVLEDLTFQDFGFSGNLPDSQKLLKKTIELRHKHGTQDVSMDLVVKETEAKEALSKFRKAKEKAKSWWSAHPSNWSRLQGLEDALRSSSPARQQRALGFLRYPNSTVAGLNLQSYRQRLLPSVKRLAETGSAEYEGARDQARLLLKEVPSEAINPKQPSSAGPNWAR